MYLVYCYLVETCNFLGMQWLFSCGITEPELRYLTIAGSLVLGMESHSPDLFLIYLDLLELGEVSPYSAHAV